LTGSFFVVRGNFFCPGSPGSLKADGGVWRVAFAFDPERNAVLLVAGDKSGASEKKFYKRLIEKADKRYKEHLDNL
jgi:hypothetical protein